MLFYIQMAVVSTAIFFLFSPSFSFFLEIKVQIYMSYFAYACKTEGNNGISHLISELLRTLDSSLRDRLFVLQNEVF